MTLELQPGIGLDEQYGALVIDQVDGTVTNGLTVPLGGRFFTSLKVPFGDNDAEFLGSRIGNAIRSANFCLRFTRKAQNISIIGAEVNELLKLAKYAYLGLLLYGVPRAGIAVSFAGDAERLRKYCSQQTAVRNPSLCWLRLSDRDLISAVQTGFALMEIEGKGGPINAAARAYYRAMHERSSFERGYELVRGLESLCVPRARNTKSDFRSRAKVFCGSSNDAARFFAEAYEFRNAVSHFIPIEEKVFKTLSPQEREQKCGQVIAQMEVLLSIVLVRILQSAKLSETFITRESASVFWSAPGNDQASTWGPPIDLELSLAERSFDQLFE
jgi:hypothetical protein